MKRHNEPESEMSMFGNSMTGQATPAPGGAQTGGRRSDQGHDDRDVS